MAKNNKKNAKGEIYTNDMLTQEDIKFLARKIKLSPDRAKILFEEKTDADLMFEQISNRRVTKKEMWELSFPVFIKILINREAKDLDQKYKNYISDFVGVFYPQIVMASRIKTKIPRKPVEENAQYFFTLLSFFEEDVDTQMNISQIRQVLEYSMDTFTQKKGRDYAEAISASYEYFSKIRKKWMP